MKHYHFNYNEKFKCIAEKCKHNCCIGWDIAIDKKSLDFYKTLEGEDSRFSTPYLNGKSFTMKNMRCVFLDDDNLCHIIKNYGEKSLCKTCKTHPRFKNFFTGITETGLGLYCEHACKIILQQKNKMRLDLIKTDNKPICLSAFEKRVLAFRKKVINIIQNRKLTLEDRLNELEQLSKIDLNKITYLEWQDFFNKLEKLPNNNMSYSIVNKAEGFLPLASEYQLQLEQLLSYLAFRHLSRGIDFLDLNVRLAFVCLSLKMINQLFCLAQEQSLNSLIEVCRFYSAEIETNDDNIFNILNKLESLITFPI